MADTQMGVSPAETIEAGVPEILQNPQGVLESRAFYSSNPDFLDGASVVPQSHDDVEMAVISHAAGQSINGRDQEILHALRYMRVREGRSEGEGFLIVDHALVAKGLKWIRRNIKDKTMRQDIVKAKNDLVSHTQTAESPAEDTAEPVSPSPPRISNKAKRREQQKKERLERQAEHDKARDEEIEQASEWATGNMKGSRKFFASLELLRSSYKPSGNVLVTAEEDLSEHLLPHIRNLLDDPRSIVAEIEDSMGFRAYLEENGLTIVSELHDYYGKKVGGLLNDKFYGSANETKDAYQVWISIFSGLSDEYKASLGYGDGKRGIKLLGEDIGTDMVTHTYGINLLYNSIKNAGKADPEEFIDLVHSLTCQAYDSDDEFVKENFLHLMSAAMAKIHEVAAIIINAPIADGLSEESRLKAMDFILTLRTRPVYSYKPMGYMQELPKKLKKYDTTSSHALRAGIKGKKGSNPRLYEITAGPLMERIKAGELEGSLYQRIKATPEEPTTESLPEDT